MMVMPESLVEGKNYKELEIMKKEINQEINDYLNGNTPEEEKYCKPGPKTRYSMNLQYLKAIDERLELIGHEGQKD
jgi:hypothetical protein